MLCRRRPVRRPLARPRIVTGIEATTIWTDIGERLDPIARTARPRLQPSLEITQGKGTAQKLVNARVARFEHLSGGYGAKYHDNGRLAATEVGAAEGAGESHAIQTWAYGVREHQLRLHLAGQHHRHGAVLGAIDLRRRPKAAQQSGQHLGRADIGVQHQDAIEFCADAAGF